MTDKKRTQAEDSLLAAVADQSGGAAWLGALRGEAKARLAEEGLPTRRVESWKFTDLRAKLREALAPAAPSKDITVTDAFAPVDGPAVTIVNGFLAPEASDLDALPDGVEAVSLAAALESDPASVQAGLSPSDGRALQDLNAALMTDGLVLRVAAGVKVERPLRIRYGASGEAAGAGVPAHHVRTLIALGAGASATVYETHAGPDSAPYLANVVTDVTLAAGAALTHLRVQAEGGSAMHLSGLDVRLASEAAYDGFLLTEGASLSRSEARFDLAGAGARLGYHGASLLAGARHGDVTTFIDHAAPDCVSRETFRSAIDDAARGVFQGKILVRKGAQKTDGRMGAHALLLSPKAEADAKPELEIYADDVQCAHGATSGDLDEDALFYMRSRGIDGETARALLINAFLAEALEPVADEAARDILSARIERAFGKGDGR